MKRIVFVLILVSLPTFADDRMTTHEMIQNIERQIQEREDRNREKFENMERRTNEQQLLDELRDQKRQYEIDRIIDESNNR
ncbi:MAG: hypothetical protein QX193_06780 [Methylococcales bacterium]|jgi:CRP-like cAMP-binding protein